VGKSADAMVIGLDLGTTVCKGVLVDEKLRVLSRAERYYPLIKISGDEIEQDANLWWQVTRQILTDLLASPEVQTQRVKGISVSTQGISIVPVDEQLHPLRNALSWLDVRATEQRDQFLRSFDERTLFKITGKRANVAYVLAKLLWLKQNEPDIYARSYKVLMPLDFILAKFTGAAVTDHTMAGGTLYYDNSGQTWSARILQALAIDEEKLPRIEWSGRKVGTIRREISEEFGLARDVLVAVGGQDQKVAALGAGIDLKKTTVSLGTALAIIQKCRKPVIDPAMRIPCFSDLFPGRWVLEGVGTGTSGLDWLKDTLFPDKSYEELSSMVQAVDSQQNPILFYPFFTGVGSPHFSENTRGFLYGLDYSVKAGHLVRSVFESIGFQIKENLIVMEEISQRVEELRLFGGGSKSRTWCQIIADITGKPVVTLFTSEAGSIGAAILAGLATGLFQTQEEAFTHIKIAEIFEPRGNRVPYYLERYEDYLSIQKKILP
jgi:xylulokinase